jgi:hypothetical protein
MTDEEMKRWLMAEAEKAIDRLVAEKATGQEMSLREIEGKRQISERRLE